METNGPATLDSEEERARSGPSRGRLTHFVLGITFLRLGATAFGGQGAAVAMMEREWVDKRGLLTRADITEALTYTTLLPGPTMFQVMSYLGYKLGGWTGSAVASVAFVVPPLTMMVVLAALYVAATALPAVGPAVNGLTAAAAGIVLATAYRMGRSVISDPLTFGIALAACGAEVLLRINVALIVVAGGLLGVVFLSAPQVVAVPSEKGSNR